MKHIFAAILTAFLLTGCAGFERPAPDSNFGRYPTNYRTAIPARMATVLKDPESARYRFDTPQKAYVNNGLAYGGKVTWQGYVVYFGVNARNSFGGYTGEQVYYALIRDDMISRVDSADFDRSPFILLRKF